MRKGARVLVLGCGRSGLAAARVLLASGASVTLYDRDSERLKELPLDVERVSGALPGFDAYDEVVASPGIPLEPHPKLAPEVDLAARLIEAPIAAVTGTNGKSTTCALLAEMLRANGLAVSLGGNIGTALCSLVGERADWVVAELSSFQLEHARLLRARVAVLMNLAPDHLDRHKSLALYGRAKARLAELQRPDDTLVINRDDAWAREVGARSAARVLEFSSDAPLDTGCSLHGDELVLAQNGEVLLEMRSQELSPASRAPPANALAAAAAAWACGAKPAGIRAGLMQFRGLPHRASPVCTRKGVAYVDDSKATNPAAAAASLRSQNRPVWWLAGGRNKGLDFAPLARAAQGVRAALLFGEAAADLALALDGITEVVRVDALPQAVKLAAERAAPGEVVLLSPACASFDQYPSFEARGEHFAALVRELPC